MAFKCKYETVPSSEEEGNLLGLANSIGYTRSDNSPSGVDFRNSGNERLQEGRVQQRRNVNTLERRSSAFRRRLQGLKAIATVSGVYTNPSQQEQENGSGNDQEQPLSKEQGASQEHAHRHMSQDLEEQRKEEKSKRASPAVVYRTATQTEKPSGLKQEPAEKASASERASAVLRASAAVYRTESKQPGNPSSSDTSSVQAKIEPPEAEHVAVEQEREQHEVSSSVGLEQEHTAPSSAENQERALVIREEHMQVDGQCGVSTPEQGGEAIQMFVEPDMPLQVLDWNKTVVRLTCTCSVCPSVLAVGIRSPMSNTLLEAMVEATLGEFEFVPRRKLVNSVEIFTPPVGELCAIIEFTSKAVAELFLQVCRDSPFCNSDQKVTFLRNFSSVRKTDFQRELAKKLKFSSLIEGLMVYVTGLPEEWCCENKLKDYFDKMVHELKVVKAVYVYPGVPEAYIELYTENAADLVFYRSERGGLLSEIGEDVCICRGRERIPLLQSLKRLERPAGLPEGEAMERDMEIDPEPAKNRDDIVKEAVKKSLDALQNPRDAVMEEAKRTLADGKSTGFVTKAKHGKLVTLDTKLATATNCEKDAGQVAVGSENAKVVQTSSPKGGADAGAALDSDKRGTCREGEKPGDNAKRGEASSSKSADAAKGGGEELTNANNTKINNDSKGGSTTNPVKVEEVNKFGMQIQLRQQRFASYEKRREDTRYDDEEECSRRPALISFHSRDNIIDRKLFVCKMNDYDTKRLSSIVLSLLRRVLPDADDDCITHIDWRPKTGFAFVEFRSPSITNKLMTAYIKHLGDVCIPSFPMCIYRHKMWIRSDRTRPEDDSQESEVVEIHGLPEELRAPALQGALTELFEAKLRSNHGQAFFKMFEYRLEVVRVRFYSASVCEYLLGLETFEVDGKTITLRPDPRQKRRIGYTSEQEFKRNRHGTLRQLFHNGADF